MSNLIANMRDRIKNGGSNLRDVFYLAADSKRRIRFLQDLDTGYEFHFHSHFDRKINALCGTEYGKDCPYCGDQDPNMKDVVMYAWNVWDYDANAVRILLYKATGISPVPALIDFYDEYSTITDRDYTLKKTGQRLNSAISVLPGEISKFRSKAKPFTKQQIVQILAKAYPFGEEDLEEDENEDEEERPKKSKKPEKKVKKKEKTIEEKLSELDLDALREIAIELGISKKELKGLDEEEIVEVLVDDNDEEELQDAYDEYMENLEDDEDEEDDE